MTRRGRAATVHGNGSELETFLFPCKILRGPSSGLSRSGQGSSDTAVSEKAACKSNTRPAGIPFDEPLAVLTKSVRPEAPDQGRRRPPLRGPCIKSPRIGGIALTTMGTLTQPPKSNIHRSWWWPQETWGAPNTPTTEWRLMELSARSIPRWSMLSGPLSSPESRVGPTTIPWAVTDRGSPTGTASRSCWSAWSRAVRGKTPARLRLGGL